MSEFNENEILDTTPENNSDTQTPTVSEPPKKRFSEFIDYVELFVIAVCAVILLFSFVFRTCNVDGDSMNNTLLDKETLIISDFAYTPKRGDIIVFHQTGRVNMPLVKRVIGVGGDTVTVNVNTWEVTVTDKDGNTFTLDEPYVHFQEHKVHILAHKNGGVHTFVVPEGTVFVLGDNRNNSMDSTDTTNVGYVDEDRILGKVLFRISPFSKFGAVK
ncbi:MAG: signal peptidase I [Ruminococcaceae bacterium]|nr:signal peptidase I [Oscillospiraceae bacterium]